MQRAVKDEEHGRYTAPVNVSTVAGYLELLIERNIFVDLLTNREVCDMTMAQFSRDDILIYQGEEMGRAKGKAEAIMEFLNDIGEPSDSLRRLIMEQTDTQLLHKWLKAAAKADSIEEFEKSTGLIHQE